MSTLWEIGAEAEALLGALEEIGAESGLMDEAIAAWLGEHGEALTKLDAYCALIGRLEAQADARKAEAARIAALGRADANTSDRLRANLLEFLRRTGQTKVTTPTHQIARQAVGGALRLIMPEDPRELPAEFIAHTPTPITYLIRAALDAGREVPGCSYAPRGEMVRIR